MVYYGINLLEINGTINQEGSKVRFLQEDLEQYIILSIVS